MTRDRGGWTRASLDYVHLVGRILDDLHEYWPLTLRQIYYQLVAREIIPNRRNEYQKLSRLLSKARLDGEILWGAIEDRARSHLDSGGWHDAVGFIREERDRFLAGYRRALLQGQPWAPEVWVEKDALSRICHEVAFPYCVPVIVARGFCSVSYVHECRLRVEAALKRGQRGVRILYFGDLDPSGWAMLPSMLETLRDEMGLGDAVEGVRCALTPEQVSEFGLPHSVDAIKPGDTRTRSYRRWLREQGFPDNLAVELDALPPATLQRLVEEAIRSNFDLERFERERRVEHEERVRIAGLRDRAAAVLEGDSW